MKGWKKRHWFAVFVAAFSLFAYWWLDGGRYRFKPRRFGVVKQGAIYRSGQIHEALIEDVLREHGIKAIVDLSEDKADDAHANAERDAAKRLGVRVLQLRDLDGDGIGPPERYMVALERIVESERAGEPILVHCAAGSQRTGAAIAWYRMLVQGWSGPRAFDDFEKYQRWHAKNDVLVPYINKHTAAVARWLAERGVIARAPDPLPVFEPE